MSYMGYISYIGYMGYIVSNSDPRGLGCPSNLCNDLTM